MKKYILLIIGLVLVTGCASKEEVSNEVKQTPEVPPVKEELKDPTLEWCQLYNPNGFNTITCVLSNPNNEDIDVTYDLVYYKDGKEVARNEGFSNFQISNKHNEVVWSNDNIPKSTDVDEVKMENIYLSKAYNKSIDTNITFESSTNKSMTFKVVSDTKPTLNTITFLLYNDTNKNKKCDKGELIVTDIRSVFEKENTISIDTDLYEFTDYEIYYNAY